MRSAYKFLYLFIFFLPGFFTACSQAGSSDKEEAVGAPVESDFHFAGLTPAQKEYYRGRVEAAYHSILGPAFNGSVLVAKNGEVVFEDYRGYADFRTKEPISANTPFHLASVSKTFTGTTVMRLWEQGRLALDDTLQHFFPELPYHGITVRMLLCHRSGLPNYLYFFDSCWNKKTKATNVDVLNFMVAHKPRLDNTPNRNFHYCNTNYVLLAMIIEKITGMAYPQYMKDSVFTPLGMTHSFVFSIKDTSQYVPTYIGNRPYPMDHLDCTYGDKNIYSTVQDMYLWDKALYEHRFVKQSTLDTAFIPQSNERRSMHNYGLGWRLFTNPADTIIYHNGKWHGTNTSFTRLVKDTAVIIVLGNRYNRNIYQSKRMANIFTGGTDDTKLEE
ncbi:CubicO group peptidase (beta-lactamase class C family) [Filimonas zeae]|uniref:serine hydrolase domain-containing protein n=1 Tax=Filimonas zeae TaxID=1737353 RepID=UPI0016634E85|nr:serine hydrolase domain-containing protein [Filimonas zeae]MDR6340259.1 CubicO group peptidase (beta-lactamase class C family) [Filimonas zeae]